MINDNSSKAFFFLCRFTYTSATIVGCENTQRVSVHKIGFVYRSIQVEYRESFFSKCKEVEVGYVFGKINR